MSKYLFHRLKQLKDLLFHPHFKTAEGLLRQTADRYSEPMEMAFYQNPLEWKFLDEEAAALDKINEKSQQNILVVGCGAGREFSLLENQNLFGLDSSDTLLKCCQTLFPQSKLATRLQDFSGIKFDIIYISHHVYNHLQGQENRLKFLTSLTALLKSEGSIYLNLDLFQFSLSKHSKFYFWSQLLKWRWRKSELRWESGDTVRAFNGRHNPFGRIFFYHYFADEKVAEFELQKLNKKINYKIKKINGFWLIQN